MATVSRRQRPSKASQAGTGQALTPNHLVDDALSASTVTRRRGPPDATAARSERKPEPEADLPAYRSAGDAHKVAQRGCVRKVRPRRAVFRSSLKLPAPVFGSLHCGVFVKLKDSTRNSLLTRSVILKLL